MSHNLELLDDMLSSSKYDPVIWEDIEPLENKTDALEALVTDLIDKIRQFLPKEAQDDLTDLLNDYEKGVRNG